MIGLGILRRADCLGRTLFRPNITQHSTGLLVPSILPHSPGLAVTQDEQYARLRSND